MHAAASLVNMRSHGRRQQNQLAPLVLPPQGCNLNHSPYSTFHSSSTVMTSYTFDQFTSHRTSPSSSAVRLSPFTPPPMPLPEDGDFVLSQHRTRAISQSPNQSFFAACQQSFPNSNYHSSPHGYPHGQYSQGYYQGFPSTSIVPTISPPYSSFLNPYRRNNYCASYHHREMSPTLAIKTQSSIEQDQSNESLSSLNISQASSHKQVKVKEEETSIPSSLVHKSTDMTSNLNRHLFAINCSPPSNKTFKTRSSLQTANKNIKTKKAQSVRKKKTTSIAQRLTLWLKNLCTFLDSNQEQLNLESAKEGTVFTTMPNQTTTCKIVQPSKSMNIRNRSNTKGQISTHRFTIAIDVANLTTYDYTSLFEANADSNNVDEIIARHHCCNISCVRWEGEIWITK